MYGKHSSKLARYAQINGPLIKVSASGQTMGIIAQVTPNHLRFLRWLQLHRTPGILEKASKRECRPRSPCLLLHVLSRLITFLNTSGNSQILGRRVKKRFRTILRNLLRRRSNIQHMSIGASMTLYIFTQFALALIQTIQITIPSNTGADYG